MSIQQTIKKEACSVGSKWLAAAMDSGRGYGLGDTVEEAQHNFIERAYEPEHGFYIFSNRSEYMSEMERYESAVGRRFLGADLAAWIVVTPITEAGVNDLKNSTTANFLVNVWSESGQFTVDKKPRPKIQYTTREKKPDAARNISDIGEFPASARQKDWAYKSPWNWPSEMAWAHNKGEIELTGNEIAYVRSLYIARGCGIAVVNEVYRW